MTGLFKGSGFEKSKKHYWRTMKGTNTWRLFLSCAVITLKRKLLVLLPVLGLTLVLGSRQKELPSYALRAKSSSLDRVESVSWLHLTGYDGLVSNGKDYWLPEFQKQLKAGLASQRRRKFATCPDKPNPETLKHFGDWPICEAHHADLQKPCTVYSFGINREWGFDDEWARRGCIVKSFDPTTRLQVSHEGHAAKHGLPNIQFHYEGLGGDVSSKFEGLGAVATNGFLGGTFRQLDEIFAAEGDQNKRITVLKIDCEGCEWEALAHLAAIDGGTCNTLKNVKEIAIEFHFIGFGGVASPTLEQITTAFDYLYGSCGFRNSYLFSEGILKLNDDAGKGKRKAFIIPEDSTMQSDLIATGIHPNIPCVNVVMQNPEYL